MKKIIIAILSCSLVVGGPPLASADHHDEILDLSLEDLMKIEISSVSKRGQSLTTTAASVTVLTQEDIRRSGVETIPQLLRLVPGVHVAQINSHTYSISIRGFSGQFANKLLVLIDGRSVYTPLFGGVFWDMHDLDLHDIDQIEVIRGPGASVWGSNAVNGVINIITKKSSATLGGRVSLGTGTEDRAVASVRYGSSITPHLSSRVSGKFFARDESELANGDEAGDRWDIGSGGVRLDWEGEGAHRVFVDAKVFNSTQDSLVLPPGSLDTPLRFQNDRIRGGHTLARWEYGTNTEGGSLQTYLDTQERDFGEFREVRDTVDLDYQHSFSIGTLHQITAGIGARLTEDEIRSSELIGFNPPTRSDTYLSAFLQDSISLVPNALTLTLGSKVERNDYTGTELQPSARIFYAPHPKHAIWGAVSRAVRIPTRSEEDISLIIDRGNTADGTPFTATVRGNRELRAEELLATEIGYRVTPLPSTVFDLSLFWNQYNNLYTLEAGAPEAVFSSSIPSLLIPATFGEGGNADTFGGEFTVDTKIAPWWRLYSGVSITHLSTSLDGWSTDLSHAQAEQQTPSTLVHVRSYIDLSSSVELDTVLRYADSTPGARGESYTELDVRLGWRAAKDIELSIIGKNLLSNSHRESGSTFISYPESEVQRSVYGRVTFDF